MPKPTIFFQAAFKMFLCFHDLTILRKTLLPDSCPGCSRRHCLRIFRPFRFAAAFSQGHRKNEKCFPFPTFLNPLFPNFADWNDQRNQPMTCVLYCFRFSRKKEGNKMNLIIPENYDPVLDIRQTQKPSNTFGILFSTNLARK